MSLPPDSHAGQSSAQIPYATSAPEDTTENNLQVPADARLAHSRPESPVNRKRTEDDDGSSNQGRSNHYHPLDGSMGGNSSLPPLKKSKTSPPLPPSSTSMTDYRTSKEIFEDALSPQTSPILEPTVPSTTIAHPSTSEKRYSPVSGGQSHSKARKLDEMRPISPSFAHHEASLIDSLSKASETSLGNLNLGTPVARMPIAERAMGVITSRPNSRQASPSPSTGSVGQGVLPHHLPQHLHHDIAGSKREHSPNFSDMATSSDDDRARRAILETSVDFDEHPLGEDPEGHSHLGHDGQYEIGDDMIAEGAFVRARTSESEQDHYADDSLDEIDVENIGMLDSDLESVGSPYDDPDPDCIDRLTEDESDVIAEEARVHGVGYVIRKYILSNVFSTKKMLLMTVPDDTVVNLPEDLTENDLIRHFSDRLKKLLRRRKRLENVHTLENVIDLLKKSKKIMVLTGAGVSVSCGIPDFRSPDGIYSRLSEFELDDPQQMFDLEFFRERPEIFYSFAREIFPSNFTPSPSHYFIKLLEDQGKLLRNYTQNIDTLEQKAGIHNVLQCHGSFATASCVRCGHQVKGDDIKDSIFKQEVAYCKVCKTPSPPPKAKKRSKARYNSSDEDESDEDDEPNQALMKPDIVFFGEKLPPLFDQSLKTDRDIVDLLIVIGSSLKVAPVSDIMHQLPNSVPQILINRTPITHMEFDVQLLGNCDTIVAELCRMAGWELKHDKLPGGTSNVPDMATNTNLDGSGQGGRAHWSVIEPNTYLFEGAILEDIEYEAAQGKSRKRGRLEGEDAAEDGMGSSADESSRRREFNRGERYSSAGLMDEDDPDVGEEPMPGVHQGLDYHHLHQEGSESDESEDTVQGTAVSAEHVPGYDTWVPPPVGFATGTTEPRTGSLLEIHQQDHGETGSGRISSASSSSASSAAAAAAGGVSAGGAHGEDGGDNKIRALFTEKMPKELGEEDEFDEAGSTLESSNLGPGFGQHGLGHTLAMGHVAELGRRKSADLGAITEDTAHEDEALLDVDGGDDHDEDDDGQIHSPGLLSPRLALLNSTQRGLTLPSPPSPAFRRSPKVSEQEQAPAAAALSASVSGSGVTTPTPAGEDESSSTPMEMSPRP